jgi:hypothetical protein
MKALIALLILLGVFWIGKQLFLSYRAIEKHQSAGDQANPPAQAAASAQNLPGLPPSLEASLSAAEKQGASGLRDWLRTYRSFARDPRLAAIELDYVVLISHQDPTEARRIFNDVKDRTPTFSPIYERVKRLESSFR